MQTRNIIVLVLLVVVIGAIVWWAVGEKNVGAPEPQTSANTNAALEADLSADPGNLDAEFQPIDQGIKGL